MCKTSFIGSTRKRILHKVRYIFNWPCIVDNFDEVNRNSKFFTQTALFFHSIVQDNSSAFCLGKFNSKHAVLKAIATKSHPYRKTIYYSPYLNRFLSMLFGFLKQRSSLTIVIVLGLFVYVFKSKGKENIFRKGFTSKDVRTVKYSLPYPVVGGEG